MTAPPRSRRVGRGVLAAGAGVLVAAAALTAVIATSTGDRAEAPSSRSTATGANATTSAAPAAATVTIADPATTDPCSLVSAFYFDDYGEHVTVDANNSSFAGCRVDVVREGGAEVAVNVELEAPGEGAEEANGTAEQVDGFRVMRYQPKDGYCDRRVLLDGGYSVYVTAEGVNEAADNADLCSLADAGTHSVLDNLDDGVIGTRALPSGPGSLATVDACGLLTNADLATVGGFTAGRPRFAGWGCDWSPTGEPWWSVTVLFSHGFPFEGAPQRIPDIAGRPAERTQYPEGCTIDIAQRAYVVDGSSRIDMVRVSVQGPGADANGCEPATRLATVVAGRLPPPA